MKTSPSIVASAVAAAVALAAASTAAQAQPAPKPGYNFEKCYGVVKAGKNDCQTARSSCAGTSKRDAQSDAWIYLPAGQCERIVGSSTNKPKAG